jgi:hypothetical protein
LLGKFYTCKFTNRLQIQKDACNLLILNRNQIEYCSPKGRVGGSNPPKITKLNVDKLIKY